MAETYSSEWSSLYITKPQGRVDHDGGFLRYLKFNYTQVLAGAAADTLLLRQLPPLSELDLVMSWFYFAGFTSGLTLSIGWQAYTDLQGVVQAASATGLYNAADISNGTGILHGGMQTAATPDDQNPDVTALSKDFNNATPVTIFATFNAQAPGANAVLKGRLVFTNVG